MSSSKMLSSPFSTGGGGHHFEAQVQASFVALMLSGGCAPCLPSWPIAEIKLQGKIDGFDTDDLIVVVENPNSKEQRRLLGQVRHSIAITQGNTEFGDVIQAAWNDFNNPKVFTRDKDFIALITGPLSAVDARNVPWLLNQARHTNDVDEFFWRVQQAKFGPSERTRKLDAIQHHLNAANGGNEITKDELYAFLKQFHLLSYDLSNDFSVVLSLLHSHIAQFQQQRLHWAWARICQFVQDCNQNAGIITLGNLPEDLLEAFKQKHIVEMPEELKTPQEKPVTDWMQHPDATYLALAVLIGAWNEKSQSDLEALTQILGISYKEWLQKAQEILHCPGSPLTLKNGVWTVVNRTELWRLLGSRILDQNLDAFKSLAVSTLKEPDPAFELPTEERLTASIRGKVLKCSHALRKGISEGLAILGSVSDACVNCSQDKAETTCFLALYEILDDADWVLWGSLSDLLPTLAEASPDVFLDSVEKALSLTPCPFDELFAQEGDGVTSGSYIAGLLWALECLAWDKNYLVRACVVLGELASRDPGGQWSNRPSNSLAIILLPWFPQTLAPVNKRKVAVRTLLHERPDIAWNLIIQLLPDQHRASFGAYKPKWRMTIPENSENGVTHEDYWCQVSFYAKLAVTAAGYDFDRLSELIDRIDSLPQSALDKLFEVLVSRPVSELPEEQRLPLWDHLSKFINQKRRYSDTEEDLISRLEHVANQLAPASPINLYQHLFTDDDFALFEENDDWEEQQKKLDERREKAIAEILRKNGVEDVIRFAKSVVSPGQVGYALGIVADDAIEQALLPHFLDAVDIKQKALVSGFIRRRFDTKSWEWCDNISKSGWSSAQIGHFLACLPFAKKTWDCASKWLQEHESEYWNRTSTNAHQADNELSIAIEKLIEHGRPNAAINCLNRLRLTKQTIDSDQCIRALIAALSSDEPTYTTDSYRIVELIKFLQSDTSIDHEGLFRVEWAYVSLLVGHRGAAPCFLESKLAQDPEFFCEVVRLTYRSNKEDEPSKGLTEESKALAKNAWRLLHIWKTPPGTQQDGSFSEVHFTDWLERVKQLSAESGHLQVALTNIGKVLTHSPADPGGLWLHRTVAAVLNSSEADVLRKGFSAEARSRGVHWVDPSGKPERELAEQFRSKAETIENAGFQRFAVTLRDLANYYDRDARRIVAEHSQEEE